jgi:rRNA maturation endonuclease Nob1
MSGIHMSGIPSRMDAIKLINSDEQTPDDEDARFELRCAACGYRTAVRIALEACPMCRGTVWEHPPSHRTGEVFAAITAFSGR